MYMARRIAVRGIIVIDGKLLCFKLQGYNSRTEPTDYWCVPGGGVDDKESLTAALQREMIEETGIKPDVGNLLYIQQFKPKHRSGLESLEFFFHIKNSTDYLHINLDETTHGAQEVAELDFIDASKQLIKPTFLSEVSLNNLDNQPTQIFSYL